jgi:hypothetical protein
VGGAGVVRGVWVAGGAGVEEGAVFSELSGEIGSFRFHLRL